MRRLLALTVLLAALVGAAPAFAQGGRTGQEPSQAPGAGAVLVRIAQNAWAGAKRNIVESAEQMPEADYTFQPTKDVRTFGQLMGHVANSQFNTCAAAKGEANPNQGNDNEKKTTKAEFVKALADSFAYCDGVFSSLTDASAMEWIKQGQNEVVRAVALAGLVAHSNEVYGTAVPYMRIKGLVPPSTERQQQMRKPGQ